MGCENNTCHNNGSCTVEVTRTREVIRQHCDCPAYYTGDLCENTFDPCTNKCQHGGMCESSYNTSSREYIAICNCTNYFTGENCTDDINECLISNTCQNNASCVNLPGSFRCNCKEGFTGVRCETNIDECAGVVCRNGGSCMDGIGDFKCNCRSGYSGKLCQWYYNQTCAGSDNGCIQTHTRQCIDNYEGASSDDRSFECLCLEGYIGDWCQAKIVYCTNPSVCGGPERKLNCIENDENSGPGYSCICKYGYAGNRCEIDRDLCENSTCQNGGTCEDLGNNFICHCPEGYTGDDCSLALCDSDTCGVHSSHCNNGLSGPICTCLEGYTGTRCETIFDPCDLNPCHGMATCVPQGNSYTCNCPTGYSGNHCTICSMPFCNCPVNDCDTKANNGICNVSMGTMSLKVMS